ncbi:hypothetical protein HDU76_013735 [Blyttiomyces sp. JEL0837]|nr:hypothetical protein HDU76_013735 [Blyttiomyces sp. JEL0837]
MGKKKFVPLPVDDPAHPNQTPFRVIERTFKRKAPLPEAVQASIVDPRQTNPTPPGTRLVEIPNIKPFTQHFQHDQSSTSQDATTIPSTQPALLFDAYPGLVVIPNALDPLVQRKIIKSCMREWTVRPNVTNLDTHYVIPGSGGLWALHETEWKQRSETAKRKGVERTLITEPDSVLARRIGSSDAAEGGYGEDVEEASETKEHITTNETSSASTITASSTETSTNGTTTTTETMPSAKPLGIDPPTSPTPLLLPLPISQAIKQWRWSSLGLQYNWTTKEYHRDRNVSMPAAVADMCGAVVSAIQELTGYKREWFSSEAGIINFYQLPDSLTAHTDRSEENAVAPLVSYSLGQSCIFLMGLQTREEAAPIPILLRSGDIVVMSGPCRRNFHGVPRILADTLPDYLKADSLDDPNRDEDWDIFAEFLSTARININVRQVKEADMDT